MNIVFAVDNGYVQHLMVTLTSLLENASNTEDITINIIGKDIDVQNKQFLEQLVGRYQAKIIYKEIDSALLKDAVINGHITEATYYRILIPKLFDADVTKVLYLDCDLVVTQDIWELWNVELHDNSVGAVRIYEYIHDGRVPEDAAYFNAGVLLFNLNKWREESITQQVLDYMKQYPERLLSWDQDALNGVLYNQWTELPFHWNVRSPLFRLTSESFPFVKKEVFERSVHHPAILHFTTNSKPWHYMNKHPFKEEYFKYLDLSGYPYIREKEKQLLLGLDYLLFGASLAGERTKKKMDETGLRVTAFLDNNPEKWGTLKDGVPIIKPELDQIDFDRHVIIISSQYAKEIAEQLNQAHLKYQRHYFDHPDDLYVLAEKKHEEEA